MKKTPPDLSTSPNYWSLRNSACFLQTELLNLCIHIMKLEYMFIPCDYGIKYDHVDISPKSREGKLELLLPLSVFHKTS